MERRSRRAFLSGGAGAALLCSAAGRRTLGLGAPAASFENGNQFGFVIEALQRRDAAFYDALKATGAKLARTYIAFPWTDADLHVLRTALDSVRSRGMRLVIAADLGTAEQTESYWKSDSLQHGLVDNWRRLAAALGNDPAIAGLDLFNEPNPPWPSGELSEAVSSWRPLAQRAISAIRREKIELPIIVEGVAGGGPLGFRGFAPLEDKNIVYSAHMYVPHQITHQFVRPEWSRRIPYPAAADWQIGDQDVALGYTAWNAENLELRMRDLIALQRQTKAPIYIGEFSCVRWAPDGSAYRYISDLLSIFAKYHWSWSYHEFRGYSGWDAEINSDDRDYAVRSYDAPTLRLLERTMRQNSA
jgi:endoglucanase